MKLQELVIAAAQLDPNLTIRVFDTTHYESGKKPERRVVASVFSRSEGEGSNEDIVIDMGTSPTTLDEVRRVVPGRTTLFWQAEPLVRALADHAVLAE